MSFSKPIFDRAAARARYCCEVCGRNMTKKHPNEVAVFEVHSALALHAIEGPDYYLITDPSAGFATWRGYYLPGKLFEISKWFLEDDAFCVCPDCHLLIHGIALQITKQDIPGYTGRIATPATLEMITLDLCWRNILKRI